MHEEIHLNFKLQRAGLTGLKYLFQKQQDDSVASAGYT